MGIGEGENGREEMETRSTDCSCEVFLYRGAGKWYQSWREIRGPGKLFLF